MTSNVVSNVIVNDNRTCIIVLENATFEHQKNKHDERVNYEDNDIDEKKKELKEYEI